MTLFSKENQIISTQVALQVQLTTLSTKVDALAAKVDALPTSTSTIDPATIENIRQMVSDMQFQLINLSAAVGNDTV